MLEDAMQKEKLVEIKVNEVLEAVMKMQEITEDLVFEMQQICQEMVENNEMILEKFKEIQNYVEKRNEKVESMRKKNNAHWKKLIFGKETRGLSSS
jgi:DNA-binding PadR family transcriptional regulator